MKKYIPISIVIFVFALNLLAFTPITNAVESLDTLAPNNLLSKFFDDADDKIVTARHDFINSISFYKKNLDSEPVFYVGTSLNGVSQENASSSKFYNSSSTAVYEEGNGKTGVTYEMNIITKDDNVFVRFPNSLNKKIKNHWINIPSSRYQEFGEALGVTPLFEAAAIEHESPDELAAFDKSLELARKHQLYVHLKVDLDDDIVVSGATRYNLAMNRDAIVPYYKDLSKILTGDLRSSTILGVDGFEKNLANKAFVDYLYEHSFISLWFDNKTGLPVRYYSVSVLPSTKSTNNQIVMLLSDYSWSKINLPVALTLPSKTIGLTEAVKALNIDMTSQPLSVKEVEAKANLSDYVTQLKKVKSKSDKALLNYLIAIQYDILEDSEMAIKYYKISASFSKKGGSDYYEALAQVEWVLGNGKKAKEYFELAVNLSPNEEFILQNYGWFLLGLSPVTAKFQDSKQALILNERLVKQNPKDSNLQNLYLNYILSGRQTDAEKLMLKFDQFDVADNYILIARAYHRIGQKALAENYKNLAVAKGYELSKIDKEFFALKFNIK
jgi:hypothetical protein